MKPYGYVRKDGEGLFIYGENQFQNVTGAELVPVYLHPKEWVGLTPEEVKEISLANRPYVVDMVVALEARLKQKNGYDT